MFQIQNNFYGANPTPLIFHCLAHKLVPLRGQREQTNEYLDSVLEIEEVTAIGTESGI